MDRIRVDDRTVFEVAHDGMAIHEVESGRVLGVNGRHTEMFGYTAQELGEGGIGLLASGEAPFTGSEALRLIHEAARGKSPRFFEWKARTKAGGVLWVEVSLNRVAIQGEDRVLAIVRDISKRKQAETELKDSEKKYRTLFESSQDAIMMLDEEGFFDCNQAALAVFGYSSKEGFIGKHPGELAPVCQPDGEESMVRSRQHIRTALAQGSLSFEWVHKRADGALFPSEVLLSRLELEGHDVLQAVVRDISERKAAESRLKESEATYRSIFEAANDGIAIHDLDSGRILEVNRQHSLMFGYSAEEIRAGGNINLLSAGEPPYNEENALMLLRKAAGGESQIFEWKARDRAGRHFWVEISVKMALIRGVPRLLALIRDVTERKRDEEVLRISREELRQLTSHMEATREAERKRIAREIHDELGQSLTALRMYVSHLGRKISRNQKALIEKTWAMADLIDSTIDVVQRICKELRPGLLDDFGLKAAMEWQSDEFRKMTGIDCRLDLERFDERYVDQDLAVTLFRIFQETLTNVSRHARAGAVSVLLEQRADGVNLEVRDDGIGISATQAHASDSFGLMGMRERAEFRGGRFDIQGEHGKGTLVRVTIPLAAKEARP